MVTTHRIKRLNKLILTELANLLIKQIKDPRLSSVTLTGVDINPDLTQAKVFYSLLNYSKKEEVEKRFIAATCFLRKALSRRLQIKNTPRLIPIFDNSLLNGAQIETLIKQVRKKDQDIAKIRNELEIN